MNVAKKLGSILLKPFQALFESIKWAFNNLFARFALGKDLFNEVAKTSLENEMQEELKESAEKAREEMSLEEAKEYSPQPNKALLYTKTLDEIQNVNKANRVIKNKILDLAGKKMIDELLLDGLKPGKNQILNSPLTNKELKTGYQDLISQLEQSYMRKSKKTELKSLLKKSLELNLAKRRLERHASTFSLEPTKESQPQEEREQVFVPDKEAEISEVINPAEINHDDIRQEILFLCQEQTQKYYNQ